MDIKDSYLHGTVGVVKSISVSADKLKYTLADIAGTVREVTLPVATTSANGLMSSGDKTKLENLSSTIGNYVTLNTDQEITGTKTFTKQQKFTVAQGTAPFEVISDTKVTNLNADFLDGKSAVDFCYNSTGQHNFNCNEPTHGSHSAVYRFSNAPTNVFPNAAYGNLLVVGNGSDTAFQLGAPYSQEQLFFRTGVYKSGYTNSDGIAQRSWKQIAFTDSDITGNAATATHASTADKLKTKRKLWGQNFDGSADVSGSLTGVTSINMNGDIVINDGVNHDRYIKWQYDNTDNYGWRIGYLGSKQADDNDLTFDSHRKEVGWASALYFKHYTLNAHFAGIVHAPTFQGNLDGTYINALTGYSKATSAADLAATDTLNTALGKLEYKAGIAYSWYRTITDDDTDDIINKWDEVVDFVNGLDTDLTDEFVTRKTNQTITGAKSFSTVVNITGTSNFSEGIRLHHCSSLSSLWFGAVNNSGYDPGMWGITVDANGMRFRGTNSTTGTSASDYVNIIHGGNVGIGTANPTQKLHVTGNIFSNSFITNGGTSSQFVKGDGSLDSNTYVTTTSLGNYLPLAGGTMSGHIQLPSGVGLQHPDNIAIVRTVSKNNALNGASDLDATVLGMDTLDTVLRSSSDNLWHYNRDTGTRYLVLDEFNYSRYALPLTGGKITGDLILSVEAANTDSPKLVFERNGTNNNYYDWQQYVSGGHMIFTCNNGGSHVERVKFVDAGGILINNYEVLHANNYYNYSPKLDGTGATGTWGISITGNSATSDLASQVRSSGQGTTNVARHVWFSGDQPETARVYDDSFVYNPHTKVLTVGSITGTAASASSADKLSVVSKTAWGQTYWTSGGVPTSISGDMTGVGNITIASQSNIDRFITFDTAGTHNWRIGYLGTGTGDGNYLSFQSTKSGGATDGWSAALNLECESLNANFSGIITTSKHVETPALNYKSGLLQINGQGGMYLMCNYNYEASINLQPTYFKPFSQADGKMDLGLDGARWKGLYCGTGDFTGQIKSAGLRSSSDITLSVGSVSDSPRLIFERNGFNDIHAVDWSLIVQGGHLIIQHQEGSGWKDTLRLTHDTNKATVTGNIQSSGFIKTGSSDSYVLLGNGGHKALSDFATTTNLGNYLPLTGGTMKGDINLPYNTSISNGSGTAGHYMLNWTGDSTIVGSTQGATYLRSNGNNLYHRDSGGNDSLILDSYNYTSYTVKKDGTGATGTWSINISGNANTASIIKNVYGAESGGTEEYYKISNLLDKQNNYHATYIITTRATENYYVSISTSDGSWATPEITRMHDTYSKITGFAWKDGVLYVKAAAYNNGINITCVTNRSPITPTIVKCTASEFSAATTVTIKTNVNSNNYTDYVNSTNFPGLAGVRSVTINSTYLRVNTNGTNTDLTIPYATKATHVEAGGASNDVFRHVWFSHDPNETQRVYDDKFMYNPRTNVLTAIVTNVQGGGASTDVNRHIWFSHASVETQRVSDDSFMYNPATKVLTVGAISGSASKLGSTTIVSSKAFSLVNTQWIDVKDASNNVYTFANLASGTYAIQITCGNLVASGIMSIYKNITDTALDEIPLHVYHDSSQPWRPYLRTSGNKLQISSNDATATSRTVTIKIAQIL